MDEITQNINWLAVIVGAIVSFLLGWLWYAPKVFGKKWAAGVGIEMGDKPKPPAMAMFTQAIGIFLLAWLVGLTATSSALLTILLIVITYIFLATSQGLFVQKSVAAIVIEQGYIVAMLIIMIITQGIFK